MDMKKTFLFLAAALAGTALSAPVWKAPPPDAQSALVEMGQAGTLRVDVLAENLCRVRLGGKDGWTESGLNRYGILKADWPKVAFAREGGRGTSSVPPPRLSRPIRRRGRCA